MAQAATYKLGIGKDLPTNIKVVPNSTAVCGGMGNMTGGSITSELCSLAVLHACEKLNERLIAFRQEGRTWEEVCAMAAGANIDLTASAISASQVGGLPQYSAWCMATSEVEVDSLTGQFQIKRTDMLYDCGVSLNPAIDIGQVEGGFMFGVGWFTSEIVAVDEKTGQQPYVGSWEYKPPGGYDLPEEWNVALLANSDNKYGVMSSKACGEPPTASAGSVIGALENAVNAARAEAGHLPDFTCQQLPFTVDKIAAACGISTSNYVVPQ